MTVETLVGHIVLEYDMSDKENQSSKPFQKLVRAEREYIEVMVAPNPTIIIMTAVSEDHGKNTINKISCKLGIPIGGYVYDSQHDNYVLNCYDYMTLATIPLSMALRMRGCSNWMVRVPLSEGVIKNYLDNEQKKLVKEFKARYHEPYFKVHFVQLIDPNG